MEEPDKESLAMSTAKTIGLELAKSIAKNSKKADKSLVLVTGVFDILHQEHKNFLKNAKKLGDVLLVGIESDVRVKKLKGEDRPVNPQSSRVQNLNDWQIADVVFVLPESFDKVEDHEQLISELKPDYLAVSSHTPNLKKKELILEKHGGEVIVVHELNPDISTTILLGDEGISN